jgi:hypothetical protein
MKATISATLLVLCCSLNVGATDEPAVRKDTQFPVELQTAVSTQTAKPGDTVEFRTAAGVLIGNNIVVPQGAHVLATIEKVQRGQPGSSQSELVIRIHTVRWTGGFARLNAVVSSVETTIQSENAFFRAVHNQFSRPTHLEHVQVLAHIQRDAYTEFMANRPDFDLRPGIRLVLRHLDPQHDPETMVRNLTLEVNPSWKN